MLYGHGMVGKKLMPLVEGVWPSQILTPETLIRAMVEAGILVAGLYCL
jgi:hypothetical protein